MVVRRGERFLGVLGVMDTPREDAEQAVQAMRDLGVGRIVMLSGDNQRVATAVGASVGIDDANGGLLPADKVEAITQLARDGGVAMVGDGVNDAPALAAADVGIAMGAAGSDVALETADIALLADRLDGLPTAVGLARRASRTIKQNLFFSLGVVALLIPLTVAGVGISFAVIAHEGSTLVVVANALRLLNYRDRKEIDS
jgi:Cd2+/Zn2+-exporting ATPase